MQELIFLQHRFFVLSVVELNQIELVTDKKILKDKKVKLTEQLDEGFCTMNIVLS